VYLKSYGDNASRRRAEQNYQWLADLPGPIRLPRLLVSQGVHLGFEHISGRSAQPGDLIMLASHLGQVHAVAHATELRQARLAACFPAAPGYLIPSFPGRRLAAVTRELRSGRVPSPALSIGQAHRLLHGAYGDPAAFYKDANPRNFLITPDGPVTVDFDDLTLAPFGYDLAKLVVTLTMTYGPLSSGQITGALDAYNSASRQVLGRTLLTWPQLMGWAEIHHILTSRYRGQGGYRYSWHELRPGGPSRGTMMFVTIEGICAQRAIARRDVTGPVTANQYLTGGH
jgi:hypothetical protein